MWAEVMECGEGSQLGTDWLAPRAMACVIGCKG